MKKAIQKTINGIIIAIIWIAVWYGICKVIDNDLIFPGPFSVLKKTIELLGEQTFYLKTGKSLLNIFLGFLSAFVAGFMLGTLSFASKTIKAILSPLITIIKATPVASFIMIMFICIGKQQTPAFIAFLIVFPTVWQNTVSGFENADVKLLEFAKVYKLSNFEKFKYVYLPPIYSNSIAAIKTGIGLAWKAGVAAEVLCNTKNSIGGAIYESKIYLEITELFAWTAIVVLLSILLEKLIVYLIDRFLVK